MAIEFHVLNAAKKLKEWEVQSILETAKESIKVTEALLGEQNVDMVIQTVTGKFSTELPVSGYAPEAHATYITLDMQYLNCADVAWKQVLARTVAHELHHNKRWEKPSGYGETLGEALVSEGLAQAFEMESGHKPHRYSLNLTESELGAASERARAQINSKNYDHRAWFFGTEKTPEAKEKFKHWTGYSLGYSIVSKWLANNHTTASKEFGVAAEDILRPWIESLPPRGEVGKTIVKTNDTDSAFNA